MAARRYTLIDQLHMLATVPGKGEVIVTLQHWGRPDSDTVAVYVVCHNGAEVTRKFAHVAADVVSLRQHFATTREQHQTGLLSEEAAADQVARRGGPKPRWCLKADCPSGIPIPFESEQCAAGCDVEGRGRVEFLSVAQRRGQMTVVTGGKR